MTRARQPAYRTIAGHLRDEILAGRLAPGDQLPSNGQLLRAWKSSSFTVHTALQALIKEGWIESIRGSGTYVAQPKNRFVCAGLYHGKDICSEIETPFARRIHVALLERFHELGKSTLVFMDTRPEKAQRRLLPSLAEAVLHRRIQCLVFPFSTQFNLPELSRLTMPTATLGRSPRGTIDFDMEDFFRGGAQRLAAAGCRSIGLLSNYHVDPVKGVRDRFYKLFRKAAREEGLVFRNEWIGAPGRPVPAPDIERYGYTEFHRLWNLKEKPDGLMVYPDTMARGVVMAILERGLPAVSRQMKFLFHRNAHARFLCPFPVLWAISDEDALAAELVRQIEKQFDGTKTSSVLLPYTFTSDFDRKGPHPAPRGAA
jgi:DNA-binding LacI/PurR family transcriptional regulator